MGWLEGLWRGWLEGVWRGWVKEGRENESRGWQEGGSKGGAEGVLRGCVDVASFDFLRDGVSVDNETRASLFLHLNTTHRYTPLPYPSIH